MADRLSANHPLVRPGTSLGFLRAEGRRGGTVAKFSDHLYDHNSHVSECIDTSNAHSKGVALSSSSTTPSIGFAVARASRLKQRTAQIFPVRNRIAAVANLGWLPHLTFRGLLGVQS